MSIPFADRRRPPSKDYIEGQKQLFVAAGFGQLTFFLWENNYKFGWAGFLLLFFALAAAGQTKRGIACLARDYLRRREWADARNPTSERPDHGFADFLTCLKIGMYDVIGAILGIDLEGYLLFMPHRLRPTFRMFIGPQGSGKTLTQSVNSIPLTALSNNMRSTWKAENNRPNLFVTDNKCEIAQQVVRGLKRCGIDIQMIDPEGVMAAYGYTDMNANLLEPLIECVWSSDPRIRAQSNLVATELFSICISTPESAGSSAVFFDNGGRDLGLILSTYSAHAHPETATFGRLYHTLSDPSRTKEALRTARDYRAGDYSDPLLNDLRDKAASMLDLCEAKPEYFPQFLKAARDGLSVFEPNGPYAHMGENTTARISDIRRVKNRVLFHMIPLHRIETDAKITSLLAYSVFRAAMIYPTGTHVHCVFEEFAALNIPAFNKKMVTLRGLGVSADMYVQSTAGIERNYGPLATREILENCDIKQFAGIDTYEQAEAVSKMLGERHAKEFDARIDKSAFENVGFSVRDAFIPVMSPQALMAMPRDEQIIKIRSVPALRCRMIPTWEVSGLGDDFLDPNPLEGPAPRVKPKAKIKISRAGVKLIWKKPPRRSKPTPRARYRARMITPFTFAFALPWLAIHVCGWIYGIDLLSITRELTGL